MGDTTLVAPTTSALPTYDYGVGAGFDGITAADLSIPYLSVLQAISPEVAGDPSQRIVGASAGRLLNTVTGVLYPEKEGVVIQPVGIKHVYVEWKPRDQGGGLVGMHEVSSEIVTTAIRNSTTFGKYKTPGGNDLTETYYLVALVHDTDNLEQQIAYGGGAPIMISVSSTKIKALKNLLSRLYTFMGRPPLFAHRIRVTSVMEKNTKGTFYNFKFTAAVNDDLGASLIPPKLADGSPHPLLTAGLQLNKGFTSGALNINYSKAKPEGAEKAAGGGGEDDIPF